MICNRPVDPDAFLTDGLQRDSLYIIRDIRSIDQPGLCFDSKPSAPIQRPFALSDEKPIGAIVVAIGGSKRSAGAVAMAGAFIGASNRGGYSGG